ncbi:MAG: Na+/H+ antiporter subunit E, partial [Pseudomonadota bacterium]
ATKTRASLCRARERSASLFRSLDVTEDCNTLVIHAMFADNPDEIRRQIETGMERWVREAME